MRLLMQSANYRNHSLIMDAANPIFKAIDVHFSEVGLIFVCIDEIEAQKAYCEGRLKGWAILLQKTLRDRS